MAVMFGRILAHLAEDPLLIATLHSGEDVFSSLAARYKAGQGRVLGTGSFLLLLYPVLRSRPILVNNKKYI